MIGPSSALAAFASWMILGGVPSMEQISSQAYSILALLISVSKTTPIIFFIAFLSKAD